MSATNLLKYFQDKSRWQPTEGGGNVSDVNTLSVTVNHKRSHQFSSDANDLPQSKKQAIQLPITNPYSMIRSNGLPSVSALGFHSLPNHYIDRLLRPQTNPFAKNMSIVGMSSSHDKKVDIGNRLLTHVGHNVNMLGSGKISDQELGFANFAPTNEIGFAKFAPSKKGSKVYNEVKKALEMPVSSYSLLYEPHLIPAPKKGGKKKGDPTNGNTIVSFFRQSKLGPGRPPKPGKPPNKNKSEKKAIKKEGTPQKFLPNVRSLTSSGMFDGVRVLYMSPPMSESKELAGIIKGPNYLCGCPSCNFSKEVSAVVFERHAGFKTSHSNNHIHFPNGNSMHQVVQELNNTPEHLLFDAIKNVTGFAVNEKAFLSWKESCKTANGKSQGNSGKEQLRLCSNENGIQM